LFAKRSIQVETSTPPLSHEASQKAAQTILVVEDENSVADILIDLLEGEGYRVLLASSGEAALTRLKSVQPDLILSDIMMPFIDGISMCRTIQHSPKYKAKSETPVVLMSAVGESAARNKCRYEAFIAKPFMLDELLEVVERILLESSQGPRASDTS
jgi:CheY-like chemotaxis protein